MIIFQDCIDAIFLAMGKAHDKVNIFNLGTDEYCQMNNSIGWLCDYLGVSPEKAYAGGTHGWIGDNPFIFLDTSRIRSLDWKLKLNIRDGIIQPIQFLHKNLWILEQ